jgi:hypothetical protein
MGKVEGCQILAARQLGVSRTPVQPAGNHQVKYQPQVAIYPNCDALADSSQFAYYPALNVRNRRLCGSKQKGACQSHFLQRLSNDSFSESADIGFDIR